MINTECHTIGNSNTLYNWHPLTDFIIEMNSLRDIFKTIEWPITFNARIECAHIHRVHFVSHVWGYYYNQKVSKHTSLECDLRIHDNWCVCASVNLYNNNNAPIIISLNSPGISSGNSHLSQDTSKQLKMLRTPLAEINLISPPFPIHFLNWTLLLRAQLFLEHTSLPVVVSAAHLTYNNLLMSVCVHWTSVDIDDSSRTLT